MNNGKATLECFSWHMQASADAPKKAPTLARLNVGW